MGRQWQVFAESARALIQFLPEVGYWSVCRAFFDDKRLTFWASRHSRWRETLRPFDWRLSPKEPRRIS